MILEYHFYHKGGDFADKCRDLMTYVENAVYDDLSKVKVYPKIVYYYLREIFLGQDQWKAEDWGESLKVCNQAVEMLRDTGRAFFLLELLEMKIKILDGMETELSKSADLQAEYLESTKLAELFRTLPEKCNVPAYMQDCTYLYQQRWVFYIGDVLRIRREMYGLTQKELSKGTCSARTLRRAEKKEANMQHALVGALLRKLGLSKEFQRARLVTNDREVLRLKREILTCRNNWDYVKCRKLLSIMQEKISREIPQNQQYLMELEATLDWMENKISYEEYAEKEGKALQCTLDLKKWKNFDKIYLTEMEVSCIRNRIHGLDEVEKREYINFLLQFFAMYEKDDILSDCIAMYEYVIRYVASELGNMGEYQAAIELDKKVLREDCICRRVWLVGFLLYDILWNEMEQGKENGCPVDKEKMTDSLNQCRLLSHFCKQTFYEKFYDDKLRQS